MMKSIVFCLTILFFSPALIAQITPIFAPGDPIVGGELQVTQFEEGVAGFVVPGNNWPGGEAPEFAIDGFGQKYLNFIKENGGFVVTPTAGATIATTLQLWTANDAEERDPASYEIYGTNVVLGAAPFPIADFTLIASGGLSLPGSRNDGAANPLDVINSQTINFSNSTSYTSYMIIFPTVKDAQIANSMQIAEVQLFSGTAPPADVPTLGQWGIIILGLLMIIFAISFVSNPSPKLQLKTQRIQDKEI